MTDHGVMYGAIDFYNAAKKANVKPIIGLEAYMSPGGRGDATQRGGKNYHHLLTLATNYIGYQNLVKLTTRAHLEGMGSKGIFARPRIDRELLEQYHEGLVVTSACLAGEVAQHIMNKQPDKARASAAWFRDLLGPASPLLPDARRLLVFFTVVGRCYGRWCRILLDSSGSDLRLFAGGGSGGFGIAGVGIGRSCLRRSLRGNTE
jgi:DNA polymerase III alpha subunit (gram-positive type)